MSSSVSIDNAGPLVRSGAASPDKILRVLWFFIAAVLAVMTAFPLVWMTLSAFKSKGELYSFALFPSNPTLGNFLFVFSQGKFVRWVLNTFFVATTVSVAGLFFHSMAGYALARLRLRGREVIFLLMFSTYLVSLPVILVPLFILVNSFGWTDTYTALIVPPIFHVFGIFLLRQF